jgi:hypothetical protein
MCYIKAVLKTLTEVGIEETDLSADDFLAIAEWEKEGIPLDFLVTVLRTELSKRARREDRLGLINQFEPIVSEEYATTLMNVA